MCQHVFRRKEAYATPRELSRLLGSVECLVWDGPIGQLDSCLCEIDIPKTLDGAGLKWRHDRDPMFFHIVNEADKDDL